MEAHQADLDIQDADGVNFKHAWAYPKTGHVFRLSEAPDADAIRRCTRRQATRPTRSTRGPFRPRASTDNEPKGQVAGAPQTGRSD